MFTVDPVVFTNVFFQSPSRQGLFMLAQPRGGAGEVGQDEVGDDGHPDGDGTLDDEQPSPSSKASGAVHAFGDACSDEPRKGTGQQRSRVEHRSAEAKFFPSIPKPHTHPVSPGDDKCGLGCEKSRGERRAETNQAER